MDDGVKLRLKVNGSALAKTAAVISNGIVLAANMYLMGSNIHQATVNKRQARVSDTMNTVVEISQSLAGLTKVITEIVSRNHVQNTSDL